MKVYIDLAPQLSKVLGSTGDFLRKRSLIPFGRIKYGFKEGVRYRLYEYEITLKQGNGYFAYYRPASDLSKIFRREYKGPPPTGFYPSIEEVHLIFVDDEGRKDRFTNIPFP